MLSGPFEAGTYNTHLRQAKGRLRRCWRNSKKYQTGIYCYAGTLLGSCPNPFNHKNRVRYVSSAYQSLRFYPYFLSLNPPSFSIRLEDSEMNKFFVESFVCFLHSDSSAQTQNNWIWWSLYVRQSFLLCDSRSLKYIKKELILTYMAGRIRQLYSREIIVSSDVLGSGLYCIEDWRAEHLVSLYTFLSIQQYVTTRNNVEILQLCSLCVSNT